jgi:hypothetical protein
MFKTLLTAAALTAILLGASLSIVASASAADASLSGETLRKAISGKTVYLRISGFDLPIRYAANGSMSGSMSLVAAALSRGDGASDRGKWWVEGDQLCQRWNVWLDGKSYCYGFTVTGANAVRWVRNDGASGTARIAQ